MRYRHCLLAYSALALVLCFTMSGCKPSFPYYTTEGSIESREVHVHVSEDKVIEVGAGTGMGGGLDGKLPDENGFVILEQDGVTVKVEFQAGGAVPIIREVTYNGQKCTAHEEVL